MTRLQLEHLIGAAGAIANVGEIVIIGSQSILGSFPNPPRSLTYSMEADMYPKENPSLANLIDSAIGEDSDFHTTFAYYVHGVGPETAILPPEWEQRTVEIQNQNTNGVIGICLHPADLAVSKLCAARPKDVAFVRAMVEHGIITKPEIFTLAETLKPEFKQRCLKNLNSM